MSPEPLPRYLDTQRLAKANALLSGTVASDAMPRLKGSVVSLAERTFAELRFGLDSARRPMLSGTARTEVELTCQRCLQDFAQPLEAQFDLVVVQAEAEAERVDEGLEPVLSADALISTAAVIEDELILALPIVAAHPDNEACGLETGRQEIADEAPAQEKPNPFAVLKNLKRDEH
jgi:uncharacterized protein